MNTALGYVLVAGGFGALDTPLMWESHDAVAALVRDDWTANRMCGDDRSALMTLPDGSLPVCGDGGKKIWRVSYGGGQRS